MTIKVYGFPLSLASNRIFPVFYELGLDFELVPVNPMAGEAKSPENFKRQPFGQVPTLEDGDITIYESRAIMRYLVDTYGSGGQEPALLGKSPKERALVEQWLEVEAHNYSGPVSRLLSQSEVYLKMRGAGAKAQPEVVEEQTEKLKQVLDIYEAHLGKSKYLAGDFVSLADLAHLPSTQYYILSSKEALPLFQSYKNFFAWWTDISSRPSWQRALAEALPYVGA